MTRRGEPVFSFVDHQVSDEPFQVVRVALSAWEELLDRAVTSGTRAEQTFYVVDPWGVEYRMASRSGGDDAGRWLDQAKDLAVTGGADGIAGIGESRRFRDRYGDGPGAPHPAPEGT